ncbi:hypothetical protein [Streptomyces sp. NPDC047009]|uniref:hypothetical protein n=1 Tax=Streptomyces sp. NPDC047009 TaxID=3154496 RepID=UPI0033F6F182
MSMAQVTNDNGDGGVDVLSEVELVSFTASPDHIGAFGASQLSWTVQGPQGGWHVTLNDSNVTRVGGEIVQPQTTTNYRLSALSGGVTKHLRTITVRVDDAGCEIASILNPQVFITGALNAQIEARNDLYFNAPTEVLFSPGTIRFKLHLGKRIPRIPDPSVEIDASFGLTISQGHITSAVQEINTNVGLPWYLTAIFGSIADLEILISNANAEAQNSAQRLITGIGQLIDVSAVFSSPTLVKRNVRVGVDDDGKGTIDVQACPNTLLVNLAKISSAASAE